MKPFNKLIKFYKEEEIEYLIVRAHRERKTLTKLVNEIISEYVKKEKAAGR